MLTAVSQDPFSMFCILNSVLNFNFSMPGNIDQHWSEYAVCNGGAAAVQDGLKPEISYISQIVIEIGSPPPNPPPSSCFACLRTRGRAFFGKGDLSM